MRENTLEESFTESFKTEEGWGEVITSGILVRERERESLGWEETKNERKKNGVTAAETVFKEGRQPRWRPTIHMARHSGSRWIPRAPLSLTPFCAPRGLGPYMKIVFSRLYL
jgi:hypothetical protein